MSERQVPTITLKNPAWSVMSTLEAGELPENRFTRILEEGENESCCTASRIEKIIRSENRAGKKVGERGRV